MSTDLTLNLWNSNSCFQIKVLNVFESRPTELLGIGAGTSGVSAHTLKKTLAAVLVVFDITNDIGIALFKSPSTKISPCPIFAV